MSFESSDEANQASNASSAAVARWRLQVNHHLTPEERLARFAQLQQQAFELLQASPTGLMRFLRRNHRARRVRYVDGTWQPVGADRRADTA